MGALTLVLRAYSLGFLGWHLGLLFPGLAEPWLLATAAVVGFGGGRVVRRWRGVLALPLGALVLGGSLLVVNGLPLLWVGGPSPLDNLPLWWERQVTLALLPFALGWFEGWAFEHRRGPERLVNAAAATALFWSQGPYHVTLYPHPLALALVYGSFLAAEVILLVGPRRKGSWAGLLLVAAGVLGVLWSLLGRYEDQSTAAGGGLMKPDLFQFDFSPLVRLEEQITLGEDLVLVYREEGVPRDRYLRRLVLDQWDPQRGFSASQPPPVVGRRPRVLTTEENPTRVPVRQEYYLVNIDPSSLLGLNEPTRVTPLTRWDGSSFINAYRVDSRTTTEEFWTYDEHSEAADPRLVAGSDPEIRALAQEVTLGATTTREKATAVELYLREHFFYSLRPGSPGSRGPLKHFLFESRKGYCSYFAFSMTLMLRSLGIPARVAVGFVTDPQTTVLGFSPVRAYQAHAWVEVPFGPLGWVEFDPTSGTPAPGEPFRFPKASDPALLAKMISEILDANPQPVSDQPAEAGDGAPWETVWSAGVSSLPWVLLALVVGANEAWRHRWSWGRWRRRGRERSLVWWTEVVFRARRAGRGPLPGETPSSWAARCPEAPDLAPVAAEVERCRYAPGPYDPQGLERGARALGLWFDRSRPLPHRILAAVFPWWPR